jgi:hypothetical protein
VTVDVLCRVPAGCALPRKIWNWRHYRWVWHPESREHVLERIDRPRAVWSHLTQPYRQGRQTFKETGLSYGRTLERKFVIQMDG